jgi:hypothetical protein
VRVTRGMQRVCSQSSDKSLSPRNCIVTSLAEVITFQSFGEKGAGPASM